MKKYKKVGFLLTSLSMVLTLFFYFQSANESTIRAEHPEGYSDLIQAPGVNVVDPIGGSEAEISGDYGTMLKITENTRYEAKGLKPDGIQVVNNTLGTTDETKSRIFKFDPSYVSPDGEYSVMVRNAGLYNGKSIDVKFVIDEFNIKESVDSTGKPVGGYPHFNFLAISYDDLQNTSAAPVSGMTSWGKLFLLVGSAGSQMADRYRVGDGVKYHYEFSDSETKAPITFKGTWNYDNVNGVKAISFDFNSDTDFSKLYVLDPTKVDIGKNQTWNLGYKRDTPASGKIEIYGQNGTAGLERSKLTNLIDGNKYFTSIERRAHSSSLAEFSTSKMGITYNTQSLARITPATPIVTGRKNSATHLEPEYGQLQYSILQTIADNKDVNRNTTFKLETEVPEKYEIDKNSIKIYEYGTNILKNDLFNIQIDPLNPSKAILTAIDSKSEDFNASIFDIKVVAKRKANAKFDKADDNYQKGGNDDGFMVYELAGPKTKATYTYVTLNGTTTGATLNSIPDVDEGKTLGKVLYEGVPDGDPKIGLIFPKGTDFSTIDRQSAYLDNLRVNTVNPIDLPVVVSYKNGLPDSSVLGEQKVTLILTTAKKVTTEKEVTITISDVSTSLAITFVGEDNNELHDPETLVGNTTDKVDLSKNTTIQGIVLDLVAKGYTLLPWDNPFPEKETPYSAGTVTYKFQGNLALDSVPKTLDFGNLTYNAKDQRVENPTFKEKLVISDTRANPAQGWYLTAELTDSMKNSKGQELVNALRYVDKGKETVLDSNAQVVYANTEGKDGKFVVSDKWGTANGTDGIKLQINSSDTVYTGEYVGIITWKIMAGQP